MSLTCNRMIPRRIKDKYHFCFQKLLKLPASLLKTRVTLILIDFLDHMRLHLEINLNVIKIQCTT